MYKVLACFPLHLLKRVTLSVVFCDTSSFFWGERSFFLGSFGVSKPAFASGDRTFGFGGGGLGGGLEFKHGTLDEADPKGGLDG